MTILRTNPTLTARRVKLAPGERGYGTLLATSSHPPEHERRLIELFRAAHR